MKLNREYPHIQFSRQWKLSDYGNRLLGQCEAYVKAIKGTPIEPQHYMKLMQVSLIKGAQATTAIEGNTLTIEEIEKVNIGEKLPPSKKYQEIEVNNILEAFSELLRETIYDGLDSLICPELLLRFHKLVGKELGEHFAAIPGKFRENDVTVGRYRCPDHRDVISLVDQLCSWLRTEFNYESGKQEFKDILIQAIITHVYIEWIHPFGDGNGRTGRLVEFYILLRGGFPNIVLQILSNHYNMTRSEYYRQLEKAGDTRSLTEFIEYALLGFRDGLEQILETIQLSQLENTWKTHIYDTFSKLPQMQKEVFNRRKELALKFPLNASATISEIPKLQIDLAYTYSGISERTLIRDIEELVKITLLKKDGNRYSPNISLLNGKMPLHKGRKTL
ncbi:MAG: Fic family protein [Bacteroidetes bacterium]|nr:Fic family protein [Bacteroidota bacterium]